MYEATYMSMTVSNHGYNCPYTEGELVHIESGQRFEYYASDKNEYNQKRYKAIGEVQ